MSQYSNRKPSPEPAEQRSAEQQFLGEGRHKACPAWPTILASAGLFAAVHIAPILMPAGFILGVGLGWLRERTGSILPGLVFHIAQNVVVVAVTYALTGWN